MKCRVTCRGNAVTVVPYQTVDLEKALPRCGDKFESGSTITLWATDPGDKHSFQLRNVFFKVSSSEAIPKATDGIFGTRRNWEHEKSITLTIDKTIQEYYGDVTLECRRQPLKGPHKWTKITAKKQVQESSPTRYQEPDSDAGVRFE